MAATADVRLHIERDDLAYWDTRLGRWVVEAGQYHCAVGASSRDLRSTVVVDVAGDDARVPLTADSSLAEWLADPHGASLLTQAFVASDADPAVARLFTNPANVVLIGSAPLSRMAAFPCTPLTPKVVEKLVAAAT